MSGSVLFEAIVFLAGAILVVPLAKRLGLSSVLGYLLAGILIGPYVLGFVGEEGEDIMHFAEFGVVVMLFLIGLEIEPARFWQMRKSIVGLGGTQVAVTLVLALPLMYVLGSDWEQSLVMAMAVVLSSTAIAFQTIRERGLLDTPFGSASFAILLFQDIIVIPMLAIIPLLSGAEAAGGGGEEHATGTYLLDGLPFGLQALAVVGSVVGVVAAARYLFVPMLRFVASTGVRELLFAAALLIVLGLAFAMELVGLSPALGAFLGGVVLATSEFRHELESDLEPFKDLLLGLFFMAVGASINFIVIGEAPWLVGGLVAGIIVLKAAVLYLIGRFYGLQTDQRLLLAVGLAQVGEFAFVLLSFAFQLNVLSSVQLDVMLVVTALSMTLAPILWIANERLLLPRVGTKRVERRAADHIAKVHRVLLIGFGHYGSSVARFLRSHGIEATILDQDSSRVELLRKMGFEVYYGDATRKDLLRAAGIADANLLVCAIGDPDTTLELVRMVRKDYPHLKLMVRAKSRYDAYELLNMGVENVYRESLDTSVRMAGDVLHHMGFRRYTVHQQMLNFIKYDEDALRRLAEEPRDGDRYISRVRDEIEQQEKLLEEDLKRGVIDTDRHWNSEQIRLGYRDVPAPDVGKGGSST